MITIIFDDDCSTEGCEDCSESILGCGPKEFPKCNYGCDECPRGHRSTCSDCGPGAGCLRFPKEATEDREPPILGVL